MSDDAVPDNDVLDQVEDAALPDLDEIMKHDHSATYCPEDNKLRFYPDWSDEEFDKEKLKAAGYRWASKQECYVCPRWTTTAEDAALQYVDEIDDEDYSPQERAADRAERFSGYRDKRSDEAHGIADRYDAGPTVFGNQNARRAERQAARHDRLRGRACSRWNKAEYWQMRTSGVISNALHRSQPSVRRGRILKLESEQRKHESGCQKYLDWYEGWAAILKMDGIDGFMPLTEDGRYMNPENMNAAQLIAYHLAGSSHFMCHSLFHPTDDVVNAKVRELWKHGFGPYELLGQGNFAGVKFERLTLRTVAQMVMDRFRDPRTEGTCNYRWSRHYELRLAYENAMLENEGGKVTEAEIIPGGFINGRQVWKVNKSAATGRVTSVAFSATGSPRNIERLGADAYRAPTEAELTEFNAKRAAVKAEAKAKGTATPPLLNPTPETAQVLVDLWNANSKPGEQRGIQYVTQAQYSAASKGDYARCKTVSITERGLEYYSNYNSIEWCGHRTVFRLRVIDSGSGMGRNILILSDKPQKPLPLELLTQTGPNPPEYQEAVESLPMLKEARHGKNWFKDMDEETRHLWKRAASWGLTTYESESQFRITEKGEQAMKDLAPAGQLVLSSDV